MSGTSETISQLTPAALSNPTDIFPTTQASIGPGSGTTRTVTQAQIIAAGGTITASQGLGFRVPDITTYPPKGGGYVMQQDTSYVIPNTATTGIYFGNEINCVYGGNPQGTQIWHNLDRAFFELSNTAILDGVVRYIQGSRPGGFNAPDTVIQPLVVQAIDQTGQPSSISGGLSSLEVDLQANGLDDSTIPNRGRAAVTIGADNAISGTAAEFSYALGVFSNSAKGFHQTLLLTNPFRDAGIDFRASPAWSGAGSGTDNALWLRTGMKIALDTAGSVVIQATTGAFGEILDVPLSGIQFDGHTDAVVAPDAGVTILGSGLPWRVPGYTVAALPVLSASNHGALAIATNGRNPGEGGGAGTGCLVCLNTAGTWLAVWSGVAPTT